MASYSGSEFREKLSDVTECSICAEIFTNPKLLPCVHTFCLHCLEKYGKDKHPGDQMSCPICRSEFAIPQKGFSNLPNNFFIGKIVEIGKLATASAKELVCDLCCEETAIAKKFCIDCEQKLCDRCNQYHGRIKQCQNHQVVELGSQLDVKNVNFSNSHCEHHPKKHIEMYCYVDNVAICLICFAENHQSHRCTNVDKAAGQFVEQLKDAKRKVADRRPECQETSEKLEKFKTEFMDEVTKTEEIIRSSGIKLKKLVDQHTEMLVQDLRVARERNVKSFENTKAEVDRFRVMIDSYQRYCDELLSKGSSVDICRAANQMHKRADDLEQLLSNSNVYDFRCDKIGFQSANLEVPMKQGGLINIVGELTVAKSKDRILKNQKSYSEIDVPTNWEPMKNEEVVKRIQLNPNDQEYRDVARAIMSTAQNTVNQILTIERIQNKILHKQYSERKAEMDAANPGIENERTLWHGIGADIVDYVNLNGFIKSCSAIETANGGEVYFSKNSSYSAQHLRYPPDANRCKYIYQCKVLTGKYVSDNALLSKTIKYDSVVDKDINPTVFVIFSDTQAYPEYLIYFRPNRIQIIQ